MAALAGRKAIHSAPAAEIKSSVRLAGDGDLERPTTVHQQHRMLEAAFNGDQRPYPASIRLGLFIGAPIALWTGIIGGVGLLLKLSAH